LLSDPLTVVYNSVSKTLPRVEVGASGTSYQTSDGEFMVSIRTLQHSNAKGTPSNRVSVVLTRWVVDSTDPAFTKMRDPANSVGLIFETDNLRTESSVDIPLLRTALLSFVDSTLQGRLLAGEM